MATIQSPAEQRVVLHNISWRTYADLLDAHANRSAPRFTYDMGELEARSPLPERERERYNRAIQLLVPTLAS